MKELGLALIIALVVAFIVFGPFALIWALNTLFPVLAIPYSWEAWFAMFIVITMFNASTTLKNNK